jgi:hypothetical protein
VNLAAVFGVKMNKKASANMWWIIIGAVIALVVMIILMVMFTGKTQPLEQGLSACENKGGVCSSNSDCPSNTLSSGAFGCEKAGESCCIGAPKVCTKGSDGSECGKENEYDCKPFGTKSYCVKLDIPTKPAGG